MCGVTILARTDHLSERTNGMPVEALERTHGGADPVRSTIDSLRVGFQVVGFDWRYIYVNPAAAAHGRRTVAHLSERTMMDCYPGIEETPMFAILKRCMDNRRPDVFDNLFTFPDGHSRWFEVRVEPVPEGICVYSLDIHDRKQWQLELEARAAIAQPPLASRLWRSFISGQRHA
jgi:PAS domain-containing protein